MNVLTGRDHQLTRVRARATPPQAALSEPSYVPGSGGVPLHDLGCLFPGQVASGVDPAAALDIRVRLDRVSAAVAVVSRPPRADGCAPETRADGDAARGLSSRSVARTARGWPSPPARGRWIPTCTSVREPRRQRSQPRRARRGPGPRVVAGRADDRLPGEVRATARDAGGKRRNIRPADSRPAASRRPAGSPGLVHRQHEARVRSPQWRLRRAC